MILFGMTPQIQMRMNQLLVMKIMNIRSPPLNDSTPDVGVGYILVNEDVDYHNITNDDEHVKRCAFENLIEKRIL